MGIWWGVLEKGQCLDGNIQYYGDYKNTRYSYTPIEDMDKDIMRETEKGTLTRLLKYIFGFYEHYPLPVSIFVFIFGTTGNVIIIIIITRNKDMRTVPNMYIINLAISNIIYLTLFFLEAFAIRISVTWQEGEIGCGLFAFFSLMSFGLTAYSVAVLSIQRYRVTVNPLKVRVSSQPTWRGTGAIICGVWIVAALFTIPAALPMYGCRLSLYLFLKSYYHHLAIFQILVLCVLPLCVIAFSYIMTARHLVKSSCSAFEEAQNSQRKTRKIPAKPVLGLTVVFVISYMPYYIFETHVLSTFKLENLIAALSDEIDPLVNMLDTFLILRSFLLLNSCLDPVALFCTSRAFRRQPKRYLPCCCKTKSPPTDLELTIRN
jgi:ABC-type multidrug transport system fused ATPase/permease subunit